MSDAVCVRLQLIRNEEKPDFKAMFSTATVSVPKLGPSVN